MAAVINRAIAEEQTHLPSLRSVSSTPFSPSSLASRVSAKLEQGDFKGAIRIASSLESISTPSKSTLDQLRTKNTPAHPDSSFPAPPSIDCPIISECEVRKAVRSFPSSSAAGSDGLLPQHLKDLTSPALRNASSTLLTSLTRFVNLVCAGKVPVSACPFSFGATLLGLNKPDGGVRPIAIGCSLRRLAAKCVCSVVYDEMGSLLRPLQLGFGTSKGADSVVHAGRSYLNGMGSGHALLKINFRNAFNSIRRDLMLHAILDKAPQLLPLAFSAYRYSSFLFHGGNVISSAEGVQQGDPLGPLLFCLSIHDLISGLSSVFRAFYLDDGTLGGPIEVLQEDLSYLERESSHFGLD